MHRLRFIGAYWRVANICSIVSTIEVNVGEIMGSLKAGAAQGATTCSKIP